MPRMAVPALAVVVSAFALLALPRLGSRSEPAPIARPDAAALVTATHRGDLPLDVEIRRLQERARAPGASRTVFEQLGLAFHEKARASGDPGFQHLALACAEAMRARGDGADARFLEALALHGLHRFAEAETLARRLAAERGAPFDHGLLGDVLLDRGRLSEAALAYQRMMDARPDGQALARAGELRFLTGDLEGASAAFESAALAASPRNAGAWAWIHARLATVRLAAGDLAGAAAVVARGLRATPDAHALRLARARLSLARGDAGAAVAALSDAPGTQPTVEGLWTLAEALRASGRAADAAAVEARLERQGAQLDPRGHALWLATTGNDPAAAVALAGAELARRGDVYSWDALAWALFRAGRLHEAQEASDHALAEGTPDPRLRWHAGAIAAARGDAAQARARLAEASRGAALLLPSERAALEDLLGASAESAVAAQSSTTPTPTARRTR